MMPLDVESIAFFSPFFGIIYLGYRLVFDGDGVWLLSLYISQCHLFRHYIGVANGGLACYASPGPSCVLWCTAPQVNFAFENLQQDSVPPPFDPLMDLQSIPMSNENEPNLAGLEPDEIT